MSYAEEPIKFDRTLAAALHDTSCVEKAILLHEIACAFDGHYELINHMGHKWIARQPRAWINERLIWLNYDRLCQIFIELVESKLIVEKFYGEDEIGYICRVDTDALEKLIQEFKAEQEIPF